MTALVGNVSDPVTLVLGDLSKRHGRIGIDSEVTEFIDTTMGGVASLNDVLEVRELGKVQFITRVHSAQFRHHLLEEGKSSLPLTSLS